MRFLLMGCSPKHVANRILSESFLALFWKGKETGRQVPLNHWLQGQLWSFNKVGPPEEGTLKKKKMHLLCPCLGAQSMFDILLDFKKPCVFFLNGVTFLALQGFLGGQLPLSEESKCRKYHLCSQGTSMALGKRFALGSPQPQFLKKERKKKKHEFSGENFLPD